MVEEGSRNLWITEIHTQANARVGQRVTVVIRHVYGIAEKVFVHRSSHVFEQQEMQLMDVKSMQLIRAVFDDPIFHGALLRHNIRHARTHVKHLRFLSIHGQVKLDGAGWVVGNGEFFLKKKSRRTRTGAHASKPCFAGRRKGLR